MKYRKKPVVIEATQRFINGDHPEDESELINGGEGAGLFGSEGKVVRRYQRPECDDWQECKKCGDIMRNHGWTETLEGEHVVCPGDWVITSMADERYPCKPDIFEKTYEAVEDD